MALNDSQKTSFSFKKLVADVSETSTSREFFSEPYASKSIVTPDQVWAQAGSIPATAPTLTDGQTDSSGTVKYFDKRSMTAVAGAANAFYLADLIDAIPFIGYGSNYGAKLFTSTNTSIADGSGDWVLFPTAGVVLFYGTLPTGVAAGTPPKISFYKYVGVKSISVSLQNGGTAVGAGYTQLNFGTGLSVAAAGGIATVTSTGGGGGTSSQWSNTSSGVSTTGFVGIATTGSGSNPLQVGSGTTIVIVDQSGDIGIGTANATEKLHVIGNARVTGVVTATAFIGDGSSLTGIVATGSGLVVQDESSTVGIAATINFVGQGVTVTSVAGFATVTISGGGGGSALSISTSTSSIPQDIAFVGGASTTIIGIATSTDRLVYVPSTGYLGIGNASPFFKLDIGGTLRMRGQSSLSFGGSSGAVNFSIQYNSTTSSLDFIAG